MNIPQHLSIVTIGARDLARLRAFYEGLGWEVTGFSSDEYASFDLGGTRLALHPLGMLSDEAAPGEEPPADTWNGITFAVNLESRAAVDAAWRAAVDAGASPVGEPVDRAWGGYSGYVADPEGNRWEMAWAPEADGA